MYCVWQGNFLGIAQQLYVRRVFWLLIVVAPVAAMLPDFVISYLQFNYFPTEWDKKRKEPVTEMAVAAEHDLDESHENGAETSERSPSVGGGGSRGRDRRGSDVSEMSGFDFTTAASLPQHAGFASRPDDVSPGKSGLKAVLAGIRLSRSLEASERGGGSSDGCFDASVEVRPACYSIISSEFFWVACLRVPPFLLQAAASAAPAPSTSAEKPLLGRDSMSSSGGGR